MSKWMAAGILIVVLFASPVALAQAPTIQSAVLAFLTNLPEDYKSIAPARLKTRLEAGERPFLLDVRETGEFATGYIQGALNVPIRTLSANLDKLPADKNAEIITVCPSGFRSAQVTMALTLIGYTNVKTMLLGMREWSAQGYPMVK